jgi:Flp pilus assembly protein TadD
MARRFLQDHEAAALYFNNLGAEALLRADLPTAHAYLVRAIHTAPEMADAWSNLGVVLARNEQLADAEMAYRTALGLDPGERTALANLYDLKLRQEDYAAAEKLQARVERYRQENPYYLLRLGKEALEQQRFDDSIELLSKAITKKQDDPELHFALARSQYLSGNRAAAELSLGRARELAPAGLLMNYQRPLDDLLHQTSSGTLY